MKDFIKEFGDSQQGKKIPVKFEPYQEWGFEPDVKQKPIPQVNKAKNISFYGIPPGHKDQYGNLPGEYFSAENTITEDKLKEMVVEAVLDMMNNVDIPTTSNELVEEQKEEIEGIIKEYCNRPGIMSISFREDFEKDTSEVNALIDPTNRNNWIALREELIYKLPYSYKESLHTFASEVWNKHKFV
jgi:hypothetical protein